MEYLVSIAVFGSIWAILVMSLNVLVGYAGQVSLGHAAFFGIGAYTMAILSTRYEVPFLISVVAAIVVTALAAGLLGLPSLRVQHDFLVLATIGLNFIVVGVFQYSDFFGGALGIVGIPRPEAFGFMLTSGGYLILCLLFAVVVAYGSLMLCRRWAGLGMLAIREDDIAAGSVGIDPARYKIYAFMISGAIAGLGGALYAPFVGSVFPDRFGFPESIALMAMLIFGGVGTVRGAILGGVLLKSMPEYLRFSGNLRFAVYGTILLLMILLQPQGLIGEDSVIWSRLKRLTRHLRLKPQTEDAPAEEPIPQPQGELARSEGDCILSAEDLSVRFGGLKALDSVRLDVKSGEILGLIGPNGAGKTTLFNAITGVVQPTGGKIVLRNEDITDVDSDGTARRGVGRTFQVTRPFGSLDVTMNVLAGAGVRTYGRLGALVHRYARVAPLARRLLARVGLEERAADRAGQLPIALLRKLEIGRAIPVGGSVILLDEPAAGLSREEVNELGELIRNLAREGRAVILVEHNMPFAMRVCHRLVVLASGKVIAEGVPEDVAKDEVVIEAYLGK